MNKDTIIITWFRHGYGTEEMEIYKEVADKFGLKEGDHVRQDKWFEIVRENSVLGISKLTEEHKI